MTHRQLLSVLGGKNDNYVRNIIKIKSSLYSRYYTEACNGWRDPSPRLSAWSTQLQRNIEAVASRAVGEIVLARESKPRPLSRTDSNVPELTNRGEKDNYVLMMLELRLRLIDFSG